MSREGRPGPFGMSSIGSGARRPAGRGHRPDIGVKDGYGRHKCSVQVFLPRTTQLLVNLAHGQDAIEHTLQHASVHGDHGVPEGRLGDAGPLRLQVEHIVASPQAFGAATVGDRSVPREGPGVTRADAPAPRTCQLTILTDRIRRT